MLLVGIFMNIMNLKWWDCEARVLFLKADIN